MSYKALEIATQVTIAWVTAAGAGENELPARYVDTVTPYRVTALFEAMYRKAKALEDEMLKAER